MKSTLRDGSGHRHYRFLTEDVDRHGNVRIYFRRKGQPKIRLREKPGTDEFDREYQSAFNGARPAVARKIGSPAKPGSYRWLCEQYYVSSTFKRLDKFTANRCRKMLDEIGIRLGNYSYRLIEPRHIAKLRDEISATPEMANVRLKSLRALFTWATSPEYGLATDNPAAKVRYLPRTNLQGWQPWTETNVATFCARYPIGTKERLALDLLLYTGVRRSDLVRLGPQMERDGYLVFTEHKGRSKVRKVHRMPILPMLRESIDATPASGQLVYLVGSRGQPWKSGEAFATWFRRVCNAAGLTGLSAHGLRKLGAQRHVEAGATEAQLQAWYGWVSARQSQTYTKGADQARLEDEAGAVMRGRVK